MQNKYDGKYYYYCRFSVNNKKSVKWTKLFFPAYGSQIAYVFDTHSHNIGILSIYQHNLLITVTMYN